MVWVKLSDRAPLHPKVMVLDDLALRLWIRGLCYAAEHLTDGVIPKAAIPQLCPTSPSRRRSALQQLTAAPPPPFEHPLWSDEGDHYLIHDFLDYNRSAKQVELDRERTLERVRRHRAGDPEEDPCNAVTNAVSNGGVTPLATGDVTGGVTPPTRNPLKETPTSTTFKKTSSSSPPGRPLSAQQVAIGRLLELYAEWEVEPPPASLLGKWLQTCQGDVASMLAKVEEVLLSGRLTDVEKPTAFAAKVIAGLAADLRKGRRPPRAADHDPDRPAAGPEGQRSFLRSVLALMRGALHQEGDRHESSLAALRELYDSAGWEFQEPTPDLVERLSSRLYGEESPR